MKKLLLKTMLLLCALVVGSASVWAESETTYVFTSKSWEAQIGETSANWTSGKAGNGLTSGQGIQVTTKVSGANGTSPKSFDNISKIVVTYCTNSKDGVGAIKVQVGSGSEKSFSVTKPSSGGTTLKEATFNFSPKETGKVKITADCSTNSVYIYSVTITYEVAPTSVTLNMTNLDMTVGDDDETLTATVLPAEASQAVKWTSSNPDVATVSNGVVHAIAAGSTTITATSTVDGTKYATCNVTVSASTNPLVIVSTTALDFNEVEVGQTKNLTFTVTPSNLTGDLTIASDNSKYTVSPVSIAQSITEATTITVTATPTDLADDMDGTITISGGGITSKTVDLSAVLYQVANVSLVATDSKGTFKQGEDVVAYVTSRVGNTATIQAVPVDGYVFLNWTATGATPSSSTNAEETFTFSAPAPTLTANFVREGVNPAGSDLDGYYSLVTNVSSLSDGDKLLFVGTDQYSKTKTMSATQGSNNRGDVEIEVSENIINVVPAGSQIVTLEGSTGAWYFNVGDGYLYAASSDKNYLRTKASMDDNCKATISITDGDATITFQGSNTHNLLRYNKSSYLFSCYNSGQAAPQIFRYEKSTKFDISIGSTGWRTLVSAYDVSLPSGVKAYIVTATDGGKATLAEVVSVKKNTPVLLNGPAGTCTLTIIDTPAEPTGNLLEISSSNITDNGCYVLSERNDEVGFYLWEGGSLGAGRVILPASAVSEVHEFIAIDNGTDVIGEIIGGKSASSVAYDLSGRCVVKPTKGLYIVNGKKVVK